MDASAYLTKHGWRGTGHALDTKGRGLARPLLVSHKSDNLGVGKKKHDLAEQWWSKAFDASLKNLEVSKREAAEGADAIAAIGENRKARPGPSQGGVGSPHVGPGHLYTFFQRGESLQGTINLEQQQSRLAEQGDESSTEDQNDSSRTDNAPDEARKQNKKRSRRLRRQEKPETDLDSGVSTSLINKGQRAPAATEIADEVRLDTGDRSRRKRNNVMTSVTPGLEPSDALQAALRGMDDGIHASKAKVQPDIEAVDNSRISSHEPRQKKTKSKQQRKEKRRKKPRTE